MTEVLTSHSNAPHVLHYEQVPETKYELDWADLATLDLSKFDLEGGKEALAKELFNAIQQIGFFYIVNFGLSQGAIDRQFALGKEFFDLPTNEKIKYRADLENGGYNGYKPLGLREVLPGKFDNTEIYNIPKFIPEFERPHPGLIKENWSEIRRFSQHINDSIVQKLLVLFAIILELPENYFLERHRYAEKSECHLRYMKYHHRAPEENQELGGVWVKGHTDFGSKWVKPYPGSITVNIADSLSFLTNGFLKSSIHRVVAPPPDQEHIDRIGVLYFVRPEDKLPLVPVDSPVLQRLGLEKAVDDGEIVTAGEWVKARVKGNVKGKPYQTGDEKATEQEVIKGKKASYYD